MLLQSSEPDRQRARSVQAQQMCAIRRARSTGYVVCSLSDQLTWDRGGFPDKVMGGHRLQGREGTLTWG